MCGLRRTFCWRCRLPSQWHYFHSFVLWSCITPRRCTSNLGPLLWGYLYYIHICFSWTRCSGIVTRIKRWLLSTGFVRTSAPLLPPLGVLFLSITSAIARLPPMKSGWDVLMYASSNCKHEKNGAQLDAPQHISNSIRTLY